MDQIDRELTIPKRTFEIEEARTHVQKLISFLDIYLPQNEEPIIRKAIDIKIEELKTENPQEYNPRTYVYNFAIITLSLRAMTIGLNCPLIEENEVTLNNDSDLFWDGNIVDFLSKLEEIETTLGIDWEQNPSSLMAHSEVEGVTFEEMFKVEARIIANVSIYRIHSALLGLRNHTDEKRSKGGRTYLEIATSKDLLEELPWNIEIDKQTNARIIIVSATPHHPIRVVFKYQDENGDKTVSLSLGKKDETKIEWAYVLQSIANNLTKALRIDQTAFVTNPLKTNYIEITFFDIIRIYDLKIEQFLEACRIYVRNISTRRFDRLAKLLIESNYTRLVTPESSPFNEYTLTLFYLVWMRNPEYINEIIGKLSPTELISNQILRIGLLIERILEKNSSTPGIIGPIIDLINNYINIIQNVSTLDEDIIALLIRIKDKLPSNVRESVENITHKLSQ